MQISGESNDAGQRGDDAYTDDDARTDSRWQECITETAGEQPYPVECDRSARRSRFNAPCFIQEREDPGTGACFASGVDEKDHERELDFAELQRLAQRSGAMILVM